MRQLRVYFSPSGKDYARRDALMHWKSFALAFALSAAALYSGAGYVLRADGGTLSAWRLPEFSCIFRSDTPVRSLRQADREMLEKGLYFSTFPELTRAFEDLGS